MIHHPIYEAQLNRVLETLNLATYKGKSVFVSGGTGMIGACLLDVLEQCQLALDGALTIYASTRNPSQIPPEKQKGIEWISWDSMEPLQLPSGVDYLFHTASNADPVHFSKFPVETLWGGLCGTRSILEYARTQGSEKVVYLSSGEMYGQPEQNPQGECLDFAEDFSGVVNHKTARACYPVSKRGGEVLCQSYLAEYGVESVLARPCHVFGPTMRQEDSRATSEFLRNALDGEDIVLKSEGLMERSHCYVVDCVSALLFLLEQGEMGEAYNIADETYQMTIRAFAEKAATAGGTSLRFELPSEVQQKGFSPVSRAVLSGEKLKKLGWTPHATQIKGSAVKDTIEILRSRK